MQVEKQESCTIQSSQDVVIVRHKVRNWVAQLGLGLIEQTKVVTAASELARNTLDYGGGGRCILESVRDEEAGRKGLRLTFEDEGPGIVDLDLALTDGYTTGGGLGMGLTGARRLMSEFAIETKVGEGTRVTVTKWK